MTTKKIARTEKSAPSKQRAPKTQTKPVARPAAAAEPTSKADIVVSLLKKPTGASTAELAKATQWQPHSVRGFLSGTLKKKRGLTILVDRSSGETRYRLAAGKA